MSCTTLQNGAADSLLSEVMLNIQLRLSRDRTEEKLILQRYKMKNSARTLLFPVGSSLPELSVSGCLITIETLFVLHCPEISLNLKKN